MKKLTPEAFEKILSELCANLTDESRAAASFAKSSQFETRVRQVLKELISDYALAVDFDPHPYVFPDIVLGKFGVEVKFTTNDTWRSVANSLFEWLRGQLLLYSFELNRGVWIGMVGGGTRLMSWLCHGSDGGLVCRAGVVVGCG